MTTYKEMLLSLLLILITLLTDMVDLFDTGLDLITLCTSLFGSTLGVLERWSVVVWTVVAGYLGLVWWRRSRVVELLATPVWVLVIATVISHLGEWRSLIALFVFTVLGSGAYIALTEYAATPTTAAEGGSSLRERFEALDQRDHEYDPNAPIPRKKKVELRTDPITTSTPTQRNRAFSTPATSAPTHKSRYQTPATSRKTRPVKQASLKFLEAKNVVSTEKYFTVLAWSVFFTVVSRDVTLTLQLSCLLAILLVIAKVIELLLTKDRYTMLFFAGNSLVFDPFYRTNCTFHGFPKP